jgi:SDR family mycofactocin-dependent oxidoreductase
MGELEGKVVFVTGAGRGQGRAHAIMCASEGADVIAVDLDADISSVPYHLATSADLKETASQVEGLGRRVVTVTADVRSQRALDEALVQGVRTLGRVDICIANAGIWSINPFWKIDEEQWNHMIDVNLSGVWRTAKAVAPYLIENRSGSIVMTASVNALEPGKRSAHYTAAKHGVIGLMRTVALELAPYGVRCNAVCPGAVNTDMVTWQGAYDLYAGAVGGTHEDYVMASHRYHALAGAGPMSPTVIAQAVLWLVSERSAYVTGIALPVEAGHLLMPGVSNSPASSESD